MVALSAPASALHILPPKDRTSKVAWTACVCPTLVKGWPDEHFAPAAAAKRQGGGQQKTPVKRRAWLYPHSQQQQQQKLSRKAGSICGTVLGCTTNQPPSLDQSIGGGAVQAHVHTHVHTHAARIRLLGNQVVTALYCLAELQQQ